MIVAATIGSLVGAWALYGIAAWIGPARLERSSCATASGSA